LRARERERFTCYYQGSATDPKAHIRARGSLFGALFVCSLANNLIVREEILMVLRWPLSHTANHVSHSQRARITDDSLYIPSLWYSAPDFDQTNDNNFCHKTHLSSL
jgi:hypothetical protein